MKLNLPRSEQAIIGLVILMLLFLLLQKSVKKEPGNMDSSQPLNIDKLIEQVKHDLESVDKKRINDGKAALFKLESFDLEINFIVKEASSANIGANYELVTVGGNTEASAEKIQKIRLHMKTIDYNKASSLKGDDMFVPNIHN